MLQCPVNITSQYRYLILVHPDLERGHVSHEPQFLSPGTAAAAEPLDSGGARPAQAGLTAAQTGLAAAQSSLTAAQSSLTAAQTAQTGLAAGRPAGQPGRHVLFVAWRDLANARAGGSEVLVDRLAEGMTARGDRVTLLCGGGTAPPPHPGVRNGGGGNTALLRPRWG